MDYKDINSFREENNNQDFTLISRDCVGGVLYHQLGLRFLTPTINLFLSPDDFNYFCLNIGDYISGELKEMKEKDVDYPVGLLYPNKKSSIIRPIRIDFMHYDSFKVAKEKWVERSKRINWNNIYVVSTFCYSKEVDTYSDKLVKDWNNIKYKKVLLTDKHYGFDDEFIINKPEECNEYAWLLCSRESNQSWKKVFNDFDFIKFLHKEDLV